MHDMHGRNSPWGKEALQQATSPLSLCRRLVVSWGLPRHGLVWKNVVTMGIRVFCSCSYSALCCLRSPSRSSLSKFHLFPHINTEPEECCLLWPFEDRDTGEESKWGGHEERHPHCTPRLPAWRCWGLPAVLKPGAQGEKSSAGGVRQEEVFGTCWATRGKLGEKESKTGCTGSPGPAASCVAAVSISAPPPTWVLPDPERPEKKNLKDFARPEAGRREMLAVRMPDQSENWSQGN